MASSPPNIGELARALHERGGASLDIDLPANATIDLEGQPGVQIDGTKVCFASLADLNRIVAAEVQHALGADGMADAERLFGAAMALQCHEIGHPDQASGRLLAAAQAGGTDALQLRGTLSATAFVYSTCCVPSKTCCRIATCCRFTH